MRPKLLRRLLLMSFAAGAWLASPPLVLASGTDKVIDAVKQQNGQKPSVPEVGAGNLGDGGSTLWSMLQLIFALGIIIALIYLLVRFLSTRTNLTRGHLFRSLGSQSVANNRSVHMLSVGDKVYLVGVGENVTLLDTITDAEEVERLQQQAQEGITANNPISGWQTVIDRLRSRKTESQSEEVQVEELSFDNTLREKLEALKGRNGRTSDRQDGQEG